MPHDTSQYNWHKHSADAVQWLREYLNCGVRLSALVLDEQSQIRFCAHRVAEGAGQASAYDHQAHVTMLGAELVCIDFDCESFGLVSKAAFLEGARTELDMLLDAGRLTVEFDGIQVSEKMVPVYEINK